MSIRSEIIGCGSYLPERILTNDELADQLDTSDEWIVARTGIKQRHIVADDELTSDLAFNAASQAVRHADFDPAELDLVILATATPDKTFPATATKVQSMLGLNNGAAFDVQAVCSGFIYGLSIADNFIKTGQAKSAVVIGAESFTRLLDWEDRSTCVLFGDGAGAVVLRAFEDGDSAETTDTSDKLHNKHRGILSTHLHSDGKHTELLHADGGPSSTGTVGHVQMEGKEVFRHAVNNLSSIVDEALKANNLNYDDIDWLVPHQANKRIIDSTARKLKMPIDRVVVTVDQHANTSAASIPLALDVAVKDGRIQKGDLVLMEAMGSGFTWGAALVGW
jgi:3-oxoacyl-[acyl-carrier-protein] synthase III